MMPYIADLPENFDATQRAPAEYSKGLKCDLCGLVYPECAMSVCEDCERTVCKSCLECCEECGEVFMCKACAYYDPEQLRYFCSAECQTIFNNKQLELL